MSGEPELFEFKAGDLTLQEQLARARSRMEAAVEAYDEADEIEDETGERIPEAVRRERREAESNLARIERAILEKDRRR